MKCLPNWQNLNLAKATHSLRMCEAVSACIWQLPQKWGCRLYSFWRGDPLSASVNFNRPVTCLPWDLLNFKILTVLLAENLPRILFTCLCPGIDCQYSWCFLHVQCMMTRPATLSKMPQASSGPINGCRSPFLPAGQQSHYLQSLYVPTPTEIKHCCVQSVSLGIGGSPRQAWNWSHNCQVLWS
jgi:hypothetical protein